MEIGLDGGEGDDDGPHSDAADGGEQDGNRQAEPGVGGVDFAADHGWFGG